MLLSCRAPSRPSPWSRKRPPNLLRSRPCQYPQLLSFVLLGEASGLRWPFGLSGPHYRHLLEIGSRSAAFRPHRSRFLTASFTMSRTALPATYVQTHLEAARFSVWCISRSKRSVSHAIRLCSLIGDTSDRDVGHPLEERKNAIVSGLTVWSKPWLGRKLIRPSGV